MTYLVASHRSGQKETGSDGYAGYPTKKKEWSLRQERSPSLYILNRFRSLAMKTVPKVEDPPVSNISLRPGSTDVIVDIYNRTIWKPRISG